MPLVCGKSEFLPCTFSCILLISLICSFCIITPALILGWAKLFQQLFNLQVLPVTPAEVIILTLIEALIEAAAAAEGEETRSAELVVAAVDLAVIVVDLAAVEVVVALAAIAVDLTAAEAVVVEVVAEAEVVVAWLAAGATTTALEAHRLVVALATLEEVSIERVAVVVVVAVGAADEVLQGEAQVKIRHVNTTIPQFILFPGVAFSEFLFVTVFLWFFFSFPIAGNARRGSGGMRTFGSNEEGDDNDREDRSGHRVRTKGTYSGDVFSHFSIFIPRSLLAFMLE